jgi:diaminopropionate ammonia-lyase
MVIVPKIILPSDGFQYFISPFAKRAGRYDAGGRGASLSLEAFAVAKREITAWPGYAPTPLRVLSGLAAATEIGAIFYKDEAGRFGLGSFKALGGAYAVLRLLQQEIHKRRGEEVTSRDIVSGKYRDIVSNITVTCATDGNHGRSLAWGAQTFGCRCVIYIHTTVSEGRKRAIEAYGAEVRRVRGNYDDAVRQAAADAEKNRWYVVSDTSYEGYTAIPRDVMQGYSLMADEAIASIPKGCRISHVVVQGGVGSLAAGVCSFLWERYGPARPRFIVVEPDRANCLFRSAEAGRPIAVKGDLDTIMAGLAAGEASILAWEILSAGADAFMTVGDNAAAECMRILADGRYGDSPTVAGESAVAGLAGLLLACADVDARQQLYLTDDSFVLLFGTEGATDAEIYRKIVGRTAEDVAEHAQEHGNE